VQKLQQHLSTIKQNICKAIPSTVTEEYFYTSITSSPKIAVMQCCSTVQMIVFSWLTAFRRHICFNQSMDRSHLLF